MSPYNQLFAVLPWLSCQLDAFKMATEEEDYYLARKRAAIQYLNEHHVPKCFQKLLNDVVVERPNDIFGYMVGKVNFNAAKVLGAGLTEAGSYLLSLLL
jgi:hypothetical protein